MNESARPCGLCKRPTASADGIQCPACNSIFHPACFPDHSHCPFCEAPIGNDTYGGEQKDCDIDLLYEYFHSLRNFVIVEIICFTGLCNCITVLIGIKVVEETPTWSGKLLALAIVAAVVFLLSLPLLMHRMLNRGDRAGLIIAGFTSFYLLLTIVGIFRATWQMLSLVIELRKAPYWLYGAKSRSDAFTLARQRGWEPQHLPDGPAVNGLVRCGQCAATVLPQADGKCPGCGKLLYLES